MDIVPIKKTHNREAFDCGKPKVNAFLHEMGLAEAYGATYVLVPDPASTETAGFCTLRPDVADSEEWDEDLKTGIFVSLEYFGVDARYQQQGWGEKILLWIIRQILEKSVRYNVEGLLLIPLDEDARAWYMRRNWGFIPLDAEYLFLSTQTMRQLAQERPRLQDEFNQDDASHQES